MSRVPTVILVAFSIAAVLANAPRAHALEELRGEAAAIKACDRRLCTLLLEKNPKGEDLRCPLTKTWARTKIKEAETAKLTWGFGDARCIVNLNISRATIVQALAGERSKFFAPQHTVDCVVESGGKLEKVTATLAPKIAFKNGKADKIWINLKSVDGPAGITATLHTAAELADRLGLFQRRMLRAVNRYIERHCPGEYAGIAAGKK